MTGGTGGAGGGSSPQLNPSYSFGVEASVDLTTGLNSMTPIFGRGRDVTRARVSVLTTAPTGHTLDIDFLIVNPATGATVSTITGGSVSIAAKSATFTLTTTNIPETYMLVPTISAVGSTLPGTGLSIMVD